MDEWKDADAGSGIATREDRGSPTTDTLAPGTTRKADRESTLTDMTIGRPLQDAKLGRMRRRCVAVDDPTWDESARVAEAEGIPQSELVRRALRAYLDSSFS